MLLIGMYSEYVEALHPERYYSKLVDMRADIFVDFFGAGFAAALDEKYVFRFHGRDYMRIGRSDATNLELNLFLLLLRFSGFCRGASAGFSSGAVAADGSDKRLITKIWLAANGA